MNVSQRKGVSPIIATLLLIAITVAAGIIVYVFVTGLSGTLTKSGGNQVTEQISLDSYNFQTSPANFLTLYLRNTGTSAVTISSVYFNGSPADFFGSCGVNNGTTNTTTGAITLTYTSGTDTTAKATVTSPLPSTASESPQGTCELNVYGFGQASAGTSYQVKVITADGGIFPFNVDAGSSS